jgi:hypothetical protein
MNKRIRELAIEARLIAPEYSDCTHTTLSPQEQKFAELIVQECEQVSLNNSHRDDDMGAIIARQIRQHFGSEK